MLYVIAAFYRHLYQPRCKKDPSILRSRVLGMKQFRQAVPVPLKSSGLLYVKGTDVTHLPMNLPQYTQQRS